MLRAAREGQEFDAGAAGEAVEETAEEVWCSSRKSSEETAKEALEKPLVKQPENLLKWRVAVEAAG